MALRFSTGLRDQRLETKAQINHIMAASTISFLDGAGENDKVLDSANNLGDFKPYDILRVSGSAANFGDFEILSVAAGELEVAPSSFTTEAAGDSVVLATARGGSLSDIFRNGVLEIYSGTQPSNADTTESGTLLVKVTRSSEAFVAGAAANGLNFDEAVSGVLGKLATEVWSGLGLVSGTAGWFRFYANDATHGASTSAARIDGAIATTGSQMNMSNTSVTVDGTTTIGTVAITDPMA